MAESYLAYRGEYQEMEDLARDIITSRKEELRQMNDLLKQCQDSGKRDEEQEARYLEEYMKAYSEVLGSGEERNREAEAEPKNMDQAFAAGMIRHLQMAADMARTARRYMGKNEGELYRLTETIIQTREEEIGIMEKLLRENV